MIKITHFIFKQNRIVIFFIALNFMVSCKKNDSENIKAQWINNAFETLKSKKHPRIKAIAWWHENFDKSQLRIDSSPESLESYKTQIASSEFVSSPKFENSKLIEPLGIYHSAFPDFGGTEDIVSQQKIPDFENLVGKNIVWAYFSNNWYNEIKFPQKNVEIIHNSGKIPFIRIMPRTNFDGNFPDPNYTLQKIIDGNFDTELNQWAIDAKNTEIPLLVEFGTEVNGNWFPWNAQYNGKDETSYGDVSKFDGAERFVDAYHHIIDICRNNEANNITWFFHVDAYSSPDTNWNKIENYFPGNDYIDWIGVSVYGAQESNDDMQEFSEILNDVYPKLTSLSNKPIAILEFAITEMN